MFRIDGPGAVGELPPTRAGVSEPGYFGPGNPATGQMSTRVTYEWLNAVQEELAAVIARAGIDLSKRDNAQLLAALRILFAAPEDVIPPDGVTIKTVDGKLVASPYELCEFYYFRHPTLRPGFQPCMGGLLEHAATLYPDAWAYLQTTDGQMLCKSEAEWQAMTTATWATLADGTKVGWDGIGGAPYYAPNTATGALRLPDLRGMYAEAAGIDSLGAGDARGDGARDAGGFFGVGFRLSTNVIGGSFFMSKVIGSETFAGGTVPVHFGTYKFDPSRVVPVAPVNRPRAWGSLACCYLGAPAS